MSNYKRKDEQETVITLDYLQKIKERFSVGDEVLVPSKLLNFRNEFLYERKNKPKKDFKKARILGIYPHYIRFQFDDGFIESLTNQECLEILPVRKSNFPTYSREQETMDFADGLLRAKK